MDDQQQEPTTGEIVKLTEDLLARSRELLDDLDVALDLREPAAEDEQRDDRESAR